MADLHMVYVEWVDSTHPAGQWVEITGLKTAECATIRTCGFLVHEDDRLVVVATSWDCADHVSGEMTIPRSAIVQMRDCDEGRVR